MKLLEYILVRLFHIFFRIIPVGFNQKIAQGLAFFVRKIIRYRKQVVVHNLKSSFPNLSKYQFDGIMKEVYFNFVCLWTELLQNERLTPNYIDRHLRVHNFEVVEQAQKSGKGLIFLSGHIGNFEWLGYYTATRINTLNAVMKPVRNVHINEYIVKRRLQQGVKLIFTKGALKRCLLALTNKESVALAADQDAGHKGIFVEFFNRPASTATGVAQLHLKTGAPMIFCVSIRRKWGDFDLYYERIPDITDDKEQIYSLFRITQLHTKILEKWICEFPGQYFWTHKRWKTIADNSETDNYQSNLNTFKKLSS